MPRSYSVNSRNFSKFSFSLSVLLSMSFLTRLYCDSCSVVRNFDFLIKRHYHRGKIRKKYFKPYFTGGQICQTPESSSNNFYLVTFAQKRYQLCSGNLFYKWFSTKSELPISHVTIFWCHSGIFHRLYSQIFLKWKMLCFCQKSIPIYKYCENVHFNACETSEMKFDVILRGFLIFPDFSIFEKVIF